MPKTTPRVEAKTVEAMTTPGRHPVGGVRGLMLQISPSGTRAWVIRITVGAKRRDIGLGPYPETTLAQARQKALALRDQVEKGEDPILARKQAKAALIASQMGAMAFRDAAAKCIAARAPEWKNTRQKGQWESSLETYAFPVLGDMNVADIETAHVLRVLEPIWTTTTETASRVRSRIEIVLDWARARGFRTGENPARWRGHLDALLARPTKVAPQRPHPAVPIDRAHDFLEAVRTHSGSSAKALEFILHTATRSTEARLATWAEIDIDHAIWRVPASRMKAKKEHAVPLSPAALTLLKSLPRLDGCPYVFPSPRGKALSDAAISALMKDIAFKDRHGDLCVPHGLRSTFRDWGAERTNFQNEVLEAALAHTIDNKAERAYRRGDMLERRRAVMDAWATFLAAPPAKSKNVHHLTRSAA